MLFVRQGRMLGSRSFYPKVKLAESNAEMLFEFVSQLYLTGGFGDLPREIIADISPEDATILSEAIEETLNRKVAIKTSVRTTRSRWLDLATRTAEQNLTSRLASRQTTLRRFESLRDALGLEQTPERLECFDISHSSGEATVASCVVFGQEGAIKTDYRRFNIEGITGGDDYAAMAQALERRYKRLKKGEGRLPDILFIDGGKGQISTAKEILAGLEVTDVTLIGVAKGATRKAGMETLILATEGKDPVLQADSPALHLIQQIRDEAHRFAITGHRQRRDKKRRESPLEQIAGVGPKRRRDLLRHFGGFSEVEKASISQLMKVPGINRKVAETIYSELHNE
jgi:excinuclease ABC subunit C